MDSTKPEPEELSFAEAAALQHAEAELAKKDAQTIDLLTEIRDLLTTMQPKSDNIEP